MALRSRMPPWEGLNNEQFRYLEKLDRRVPAREDLAGGASAGDIATAYNLLLADLRDAGLMERS
jgi:hypothetical protein